MANNGVSDYLEGKSALDWYFASLSGTEKDKDVLQSGEVVFDIS